jgi:hypothetical protein
MDRASFEKKPEPNRIGRFKLVKPKPNRTKNARDHIHP